MLVFTSTVVVVVVGTVIVRPREGDLFSGYFEDAAASDDGSNFSVVEAIAAAFFASEKETYS